MTQQPPQPSFIHKKRRNLKGGKKTTHTLLLTHRARFPCPGAHSGGTGLEEVTGSQWEGRGGEGRRGGCQGEEIGRDGVVGGCVSPPWWVPGEPGGAQGQQLGCRGGLCPWPQPGTGGRGSVCRGGSLTGWECRDTTRPPVPGTNSKTTCFLLLTPGAQPAPPGPPNPSGGSWNEENASGSSGSTLGIGRARRRKAGVALTAG